MNNLQTKMQSRGIKSPRVNTLDYRGEVFLLLENRGEEPFYYRRGDRLGQLLIVPAPKIALRVVTDLDDTARGVAGLGSTGVAS